MVEQVVREEGIDARVLETVIQSIEQAVQVQFPGSPSVRVQGEDIDPAMQKSSGVAMG
jgi:hypothetical protein